MALWYINNRRDDMNQDTFSLVSRITHLRVKQLAFDSHNPNNSELQPPVINIKRVNKERSFITGAK